MQAIGFPQVWRPISFAPDATLNALFACIPGVATLLVLAILPRRQLLLVPIAILCAAALSAVLGLSQIYSGGPYIYKITNLATPVGIFANRNHAALLLAMALPLSAFVFFGRDARVSGISRQLLCVGIPLIVLPLLLVNGSRSGIVCGAVGLIGAGALIYRSGGLALDRKGLLLTLAALLLFVAISGLFLWAGRDLALGRLFASDADSEIRFQALPSIVRIAKALFPLGGGMGTFALVFQVWEPDSLISSTYLNHAHNDLLEIFVDAGIVGLALVTAVTAWSAMMSWRAWASPAGGASLARLGSVILLQIAIASLFDYPIRVPFMSALSLFSLTCLASPYMGGARDIAKGSKV